MCSNGYGCRGGLHRNYALAPSTRPHKVTLCCAFVHSFPAKSTSNLALLSLHDYVEHYCSVPHPMAVLGAANGCKTYLNLIYLNPDLWQASRRSGCQMAHAWLGGTSPYYRVNTSWTDSPLGRVPQLISGRQPTVQRINSALPAAVNC
jgi:hypothetical protein